MATQPAFAATVKAWAVTTPASADTSLTAPSTVATLLSAGASGSKVEQVRLTPVATTASTYIVNLFLYDGSTYHLFDFFTVAAQTLSTTAETVPADKYYTNLVLPNGWSVRATVTVGTVASAFKLTAFGGDF